MIKVTIRMRVSGGEAVYVFHSKYIYSVEREGILRWTLLDDKLYYSVPIGNVVSIMEEEVSTVNNLKPQSIEFIPFGTFPTQTP